MAESWFDVPTIKNIHQTVLDAALQPGALKMDSWHTCETTHCRAGHVVHLAGEKGKKLEAASSTLFAAMQIYHKSSPDIPVACPRYFEPEAKALEDMQRCAQLEKEAIANNP